MRVIAGPLNHHFLEVSVGYSKLAYLYLVSIFALHLVTCDYIGCVFR